jgi:acyl carrier protein
MKNKIEKIIIEAVIELNEELNDENLTNITVETKLYGGGGTFDSLKLVYFITDLEERIYEELDKEVILADEKAMSQRTSPFRSVKSLTNYIQKLLEE